ncbi:serine/threonine-protein kinase [Kitasatospora sp. NPDC094015]|uniref:serine/threonine-protein kinase n=1 Tax=Kitasatospora sp. NPDC094015 TaxID=3155205 RepID=UPI003322DCCE
MGSQDEGAPGAGRLLAGRYLLGEQLGRGGMGTVRVARDTKLGRLVAVKELTVTGLPPGELATLGSRMQQEARAAAKIGHRGVITVYDVLEEDGRPWIVMELIEGRSLAEVIRSEGTLLPRDAARIGEQVLSALDQAHRQGVVHRDVKPANVLLERGGRAVLTDFGIALLEGSPGLTRTGDFVGSPDFIAPERITGNRPGPESDLWSLGATLYAAVDGQSPFHRTSSMATLQAVIADPVPESRNAGALGPVIEALLRKEPTERPSAAQALAMLAEVGGGTGRTVGNPFADRTPFAGQPPTAGPTRTGATPPTLRATPPTPPPGAPGPPAPPGPGPGGGGHRRRTALIAAGTVLGALLAGGVAYAVVSSTEGDGGSAGASPAVTAATGPATPSVTSARPSPTPSTPHASTASSPAGTSATSAPPSPTPSSPTGSTPQSSPATGPTSPSAPSSPGGSLPPAPAGYRWVEDPAGFLATVPQGWTRTESAGGVDYSPDGGAHLLRFTVTPAAGAAPEAQLRELEQSAAEQPDYTRIALRPDPFDGNPGARWEYTWTAPDGTGQHAAVQAFVTPDGTAYTVSQSAPADDWPTAQQQLATVLRTFRPA